eukprot:366373-Chlamydomonas_euryale.AAC.5
MGYASRHGHADDDHHHNDDDYHDVGEIWDTGKLTTGPRPHHTPHSPPTPLPSTHVLPPVSSRMPLGRQRWRALSVRADAVMMPAQRVLGLHGALGAPFEGWAPPTAHRWGAAGGRARRVPPNPCEAAPRRGLAVYTQPGVECPLLLTDQMAATRQKPWRWSCRSGCRACLHAHARVHLHVLRKALSSRRPCQPRLRPPSPGVAAKKHEYKKGLSSCICKQRDLGFRV